MILKLQGISKGVKVHSTGHVLWCVEDVNGMLRMLKLPAYYVPNCKVKLVSTSSLLQVYGGESVTILPDRMTLSGIPGHPTRTPVEIPVNTKTNLPTAIAHRYDGPTTEIMEPTAMEASIISNVHESNINLTSAEKELLCWHQRLGHLGFRRIQFLFRSGVLAHSESARRLQSAACKLTHPPCCAACQFGKQHRRHAPGAKVTTIQDRAGILKKDHLLPGACVSVDHFICNSKGRLFSSMGKSKEERCYSGGAIFIDHSSGLIHVEFQTHLNTHETAKAKEKFELMCRDNGVIPQQYISDNGSAFTSQGFTAHLAKFEQLSRFAGVGAHHHNGNAERAIQTIMSIARTMLIHAAIHWPDMADSALWPMAVQHAVFLCNHVPNETTGMSAHDLFTKTRWQQSKFHDLHVFGCPVYVLEKHIADGMKIPRWKPRSHRAVNMGLSAKHASTVPLVLNPETGAITPQFHVVFDDWFATIATSADNLPDFNSDEWAKLFGEFTYQYPFDEGDLENITDLSDNTTKNTAQHREAVVRAMEKLLPPTPLPVTPPLPVIKPDTVPIAVEPAQSPVTYPQPEDITLEVPVAPVATPVPSPRKLPFVPSPRKSPQAAKPMESVEQPIVRSERPVRNRRIPQRFADFEVHHYLYMEMPSNSYCPDLYYCNGLLTPFSLKAIASDPDSLSFDEAMASDDRPMWREAMMKEVRALENRGAWSEVAAESAKTKILPGLWVFRRKRSPDGEIKKYKARYCCQGQHEETPSLETFAPVAAWSSIRIFLVLMLASGWATETLDFSNAFIHATLDRPVWIHLPRGFHSSRKGKTCLRLLKSQYGLRTASRSWFELLTEALRELGFAQCTLDPCLFFQKNMVLVLHVDDCGVGYKFEKDLIALVDGLQSRGFELTREGEFSAFLGIKFQKDENSLTLTQPALIQKVISAVSMQDCKGNWTPTTQFALGTDKNGEQMTDKWNYRSIVGMLLFLSTNTRPDIAFAVSQVARFSHNPKQSHATAIKSIVRYLHRTADKGTIVTPTNTCCRLDCFADADFCGLFRAEPDGNPNSVRSRSGYIIKLGGFPLGLEKSTADIDCAKYIGKRVCMLVVGTP